MYFVCVAWLLDSNTNLYNTSGSGQPGKLLSVEVPSDGSIYGDRIDYKGGNAGDDGSEAELDSWADPGAGYEIQNEFYEDGPAATSYLQRDDRHRQA